MSTVMDINSIRELVDAQDGETVADRIARLFEDDGTSFTVEISGTEVGIGDVCDAMSPYRADWKNHQSARYEFVDESALILDETAWDIGYPAETDGYTCHCFAGTHEHHCGLEDWRVTHRITVDYGSHAHTDEVMACDDGSVYTAGEWCNGTPGDWELVDDRWLCNGKATPAGAVADIIVEAV